MKKYIYIVISCFLLFSCSDILQDLDMSKNFVKYEADYAEKVSITLDIKIFVSVFKTIFLRNKRDYGEYIRKPLDVERAYMCVQK